VTVPLELAFERIMEAQMGMAGWQAWTAWNLLVDVTFLIDIVINFRTGFFEEGQFVADSNRIARKYLTGSFTIDLVGSFPLSLILIAMDDEGENNAAARLNRQLRFLRIVKLNRLLRLVKLSKNLRHVEMVIKFNPSVMRLTKLFIMMLLFSHWLGCAWWFVADLELTETCETIGGLLSAACAEPSNAWQPNADLLRSDRLGRQWSAAFFWGVGMVTAMVPYDIQPETEIEVWVTAISMFIGLLLNAFAIGSMASALSSLDAKKSIAAEKLDTLGHYLQINAIGPDLRSRIFEFYEYLYTSSQSMEDLHLYQDLPPSLATRLSITVNRRIIARCSFLLGLTDDLLLCVIGRLRPCIFVPAQVVFTEGERLKTTYYVKKGTVVKLRAMGTEREMLIATVGQHENFGLDLANEGHDPSGRRAISLTQTYQYAKETARAEMYCDVMTVSLEDLSPIFAHHDAWSRVFPTGGAPGGPAKRSCGGCAKLRMASRLTRLKNSALSPKPKVLPDATQEGALGASLEQRQQQEEEDGQFSSAESPTPAGSPRATPSR